MQCFNLSNHHWPVRNIAAGVILVIGVINICKPEEGWYGQPKYCYEKIIHVFLISFAVVYGLLCFAS